MAYAEYDLSIFAASYIHTIVFVISRAMTITRHSLSMISKNAIFFLLFLSLCSCNKEIEQTLHQRTYTLSFTRMADLSAEAISTIDMLLFDNENQLSVINNNVQSNNDYYPISFDKSKVKSVFILANNESIELSESKLNGMDISEVALLQTSPIDYINSFPSMFYTGVVETELVTTTNLNVGLTRSLSRIDVKIADDADVVIDSCIVANLIDRTVLMPGKPLTPTPQN